MYFKITMLFALLICSCSNELSGATVGTGNPQITISGTLVTFEKSQLDSTSQVNLNFYRTDTKPWEDATPLYSTKSSPALFSYQEEYWAVDLSSLDWDGLSDSLVLSNLIISTNDERVKLIRNVHFDSTFHILDSNKTLMDELNPELGDAQKWDGNIQYFSGLHQPPKLGFIGTPFFAHADANGDFSFEGLTHDLGELKGVSKLIAPGGQCPFDMPADECPPEQGEEVDISIIGEYIPGEPGSLQVAL